MQIIGCAPGGALRGWAPLAPRSPSGFDSLRGIKMYALSPGCGSFRRRPFSGSPMAAPRCGSGGRAAPAPACRGFPPGACPRRSGCSPRRLRARVPFCGLWPPLRSALRLAPLLRPFPRSRGAPGRCGASSRPCALGGALARAGAPVPPCPAPLRGFARSRSPGGAPTGAACAAPFGASVAPPGVWGWCCRRCGGGAAAPFCFASGRVFSGFPPRLRGGGAARMLFRGRRDDRQCPNKIRRATILSA